MKCLVLWRIKRAPWNSSIGQVTHGRVMDICSLNMYLLNPSVRETSWLLLSRDLGGWVGNLPSPASGVSEKRPHLVSLNSHTRTSSPARDKRWAVTYLIEEFQARTWHDSALSSFLLFGICLVSSWSCVELNSRDSVLMGANLWFPLMFIIGTVNLSNMKAQKVPGLQTASGLPQCRAGVVSV